MEVVVLEAENAPKKPVIAVRAGSSLRHVDMALNTPFHVPLHGLQDGSIKISLFEQLGTQTIPDADEVESVCNVPVRTPSGTCSQVKLRIRRGMPCTGPTFKSSTIGVEDYLNSHQLEARIQSLFEIVLKKQPTDPYRCMIEELHKIKGPGGESACAADMAAAAEAVFPKAPVPPSEPPPQNARPSPAKNRNLKQRASQEEIDTQRALAEVMRMDAGKVHWGGSTSAHKAREKARHDATMALSNLELAHEVMRHCIRQFLATVSTESHSLGGARQYMRHRAMEHAKMVKVSRPVLNMVWQGAHVRIEAKALGILGGGASKSDAVVYKKDKALAEEEKKNMASLKMEIYKRASLAC